MSRLSSAQQELCYLPAVYGYVPGQPVILEECSGEGVGVVVCLSKTISITADGQRSREGVIGDPAGWYLFSYEDPERVWDAHPPVPQLLDSIARPRHRPIDDRHGFRRVRRSGQSVERRLRLGPGDTRASQRPRPRAPGIPLEKEQRLGGEGECVRQRRFPRRDD